MRANMCILCFLIWLLSIFDIYVKLLWKIKGSVLISLLMHQDCVKCIVKVGRSLCFYVFVISFLLNFPWKWDDTCHLSVDYLWDIWFCFQFPRFEKVVWSVSSCQVWVISAVVETIWNYICTVKWFRFLRTPQDLMTQCLSLAAEGRLQIFSLPYVFTTVLLVLIRRLYSRLDSVEWMTCVSCWPHFNMAWCAATGN